MFREPQEISGMPRRAGIELAPDEALAAVAGAIRDEEADDPSGILVEETDGCVTVTVPFEEVGGGAELDGLLGYVRYTVEAAAAGSGSTITMTAAAIVEGTESGRPVNKQRAGQIAMYLTRNSDVADLVSDTLEWWADNKPAASNTVTVEGWTEIPGDADAVYDAVAAFLREAIANTPTALSRGTGARSLVLTAPLDCDDYDVEGLEGTERTEIQIQQRGNRADVTVKLEVTVTAVDGRTSKRLPEKAAQELREGMQEGLNDLIHQATPLITEAVRQDGRGL